jgi:hypothetical protein
MLATLLILAAAIHNPIPLRTQWDENGGYCGETCLVSAGLYYGQYLSQYDVRAAGDGKKGQHSQVLLQTQSKGSVQLAAKNVFLTSEPYVSPPGQQEAFLAWVKSRVQSGYPVAIGVYMNQSLFGGHVHSTYDHIILVTGIDDEDTLYFWDNGLWTGDPNVPAYTSCKFSAFGNTRKGANKSTANLYSLPNDRKVENYGIAITGTTDPSGETTVPLTAIVSTYSEMPEIVDGSSKRPARPKPITVTVTATNLQSGTYNLYKYDSLSGSSRTWLAELSSVSPTYVDTILPDPDDPPTTSSIAIYRAVSK